MSDDHLSLGALEGALQTAPMGVFFVRMENLDDDRSFRIVFANRSTERHFGVSPESIIGKRSEEAAPGLRERGLIDLFARVVRTGKAEDYEDTYYADERIQAAFSGHVVRVATDMIAIWFENTTARRIMEAEAARAAVQAREAEENTKLLQGLEKAHAATMDVLDTYELVTQAAGEALWEVPIDADGNFLEGRVSGRLAQILGYAPSELPAGIAAIAHVAHPEDRPKLFEAWDRLSQNPRERFITEYRAISKSGEIFHFQSTAQLALDDAGRPRKAAGSLRDITAQRKAEDALRERIAQVEEQRVLIDELSAPILDVSEDVIALPIVGTLDDRRAAKTTTALLDEISRRGARFALVDLTGVNAMDAGTAEHIVRIAQAVELLGARVVLTGIQPNVARTLVELGVDLTKIASRRNLRQGIAESLTRFPRERASAR